MLMLGVRGFNSTTNRHAAVGTLMGILDQARTVAVSDGRATYIVFMSAPRGQDQSNAGVPARMWGRAYTLFEDPVLQDTSTASSFLPQQRSAWLYLPTGIAFKCDDGTDATTASLTATQTTSNDPQFTVPVPGSSAKALSLPYVKFDATGQIVNAAGQVLNPGDPTDQQKLRILLFEGTTSSAGAEVATRRSAGTTGNNIRFAFDEIMLKPTTGRAQYTFDPSNNLTASN